MTTSFQVIRWDSYNIVVHFKNDDWTDINITNNVVFFTVKDIFGLEPSVDTNAKIQKTITVHSDPTHGKTILPLTASDTNLTPGEYVFDFQLKTATGDIHSTQSGTFIVTEDVTKRTV